MRPVTIKTAPHQSMLGFVSELRFSEMSEGMVRYDVMAVIAVRMVPIQKYHPQEAYSAVTPAKKIPMLILISSSLGNYGNSIQEASGCSCAVNAEY